MPSPFEGCENLHNIDVPSQIRILFVSRGELAPGIRLFDFPGGEQSQIRATRNELRLLGYDVDILYSDAVTAEIAKEYDIVHVWLCPNSS